MSAPIRNNEGGYIALITAILLSISLLIMIVAVSFEGFASRYTILESELKEESIFLAEACVQTAILKLVQDETYAGANDQINIGDKQCLIKNIDSSDISNVIVRVSASSSAAHTNLLVKLDLSNSPIFNIKSWDEVPTHP